eukprot:360622-Chlamydomonas_euryale.AAC.17
MRAVFPNTGVAPMSARINAQPGQLTCRKHHLRSLAWHKTLTAPCDYPMPTQRALWNICDN